MTSTLTKPGPRWSPIFTPGAVAKPDVAMGHKLVDLLKLGIYVDITAHDAPVQSDSGQGGYLAAGDILTTTIDGFDLNSLWTEFQRVVALKNAQRTTLQQLITFPVQSNIERVPAISQASFEVASEYGEPRGMRPKSTYFTLGYDFADYDLATRFTWKYLRDADQRQVEATNVMAVEADNRLIYNKVMDALYNNVNRLADINGQDVNVYSLYNADGTVPPTYKTNVFNGTHTHYLVSGAATVDSGDLDEMYEHVRHHGYSSENGVTHYLMVNTIQGNTIKNFRVSTGANYDFIPSLGAPAAYLPIDQRIVNGTQKPASISGVKVLGSYGDLTILVDDMFPVGYMVLIATGGPESLTNPVGFREHQNPSFRGLRLVKGPTPDYPLIDSFYQRSFGTGIRQRGGAVIMQIKATGSYVPPTWV